MEDKKEKTPTATQEKRTIRKGEPVAIFANTKASPDNPNEFIEVCEIEGIGTLTGTANLREIQGRKGWLVEFEIQLPSSERTGYTQETLQGEPGENLVIFALLTSSSGSRESHRASLGTISQKNGVRVLEFKQWHIINPSETKNEFIHGKAKKPGNSLILPDGSNLRFSKFVFS